VVALPCDGAGGYSTEAESAEVTMATKSNEKSKAVEPKKTPKDLPVRKTDADKVKGGRGAAGSEVLR
jgi:hypothetical protein